MLLLALAGAAEAIVAPAPGVALSFEGQEARIARELSEGVEAQRIAAASELATLSPGQALPLVRRALGDVEPEVRRRAVEAAIELRLVEVLEVTRGWLEDEAVGQREIAVRAEGALGGPSSVPVLARALGDVRFTVRSAAARSLGQLALAACAAPLGTALDDTDATVRVLAAEALARVPGEEATRLLLARSLDASLEVRVAVLAALSQRVEFGVEPRVTAVLLAALADDAPEVRVVAIVGLGRARAIEAAPHLAQRLEAAAQQAVRGANATREVQSVLAALGRIDDPRARDALARALGTGASRGPVLDALGVQHGLAPHDTERALRDALDASVERRASRVAITEGLLALGPLEGDDALAALVLTLLAEGALPDRVGLPALGATLPRTTAAGSATSEEAMVRLLGAASDRASASSAIEGLTRAADRGVLDPRALDVLLLPEVLEPPSVQDESVATTHRTQVIALLGRLGDVRALPTLLARARGPAGAERREALRVLVASPVLSDAARGALLNDVVTHLASPDAQEREAIRRLALREGDADTLSRLLDALEGVDLLDRPSALEVVAAIATGPHAMSLGPALQARAERVTSEALASSDPRLASAAAAAWVSAASVTQPAALADAIARARERHAGGDAVALARLARASDCTSDVCMALRRSGPEGDLDEATVARLLEPEWRFPQASTRSFALLAAARRGELGADAVPSLCALAARREPSVRANAALALAALSASCEGIDAASWLLSAQSSSVQLAAAHWCAALERAPSAGATPCEPRLLARATRHCLDSSADASLREACGRLEAHTLTAPLVEPRGLLDVVALDATARPMPGRLVAVRFVDGATLVLATDAAGRIATRVDHAPGPTRLEDPYAAVLER